MGVYNLCGDVATLADPWMTSYLAVYLVNHVKFVKAKYYFNMKLVYLNGLLITA